MEKFLRLKNILDENNVVNRVEEIEYDDNSKIKYLFLEFPIARECEELRITEDDCNIESIINSNFLKYRGISNYEAIWSSELNTIECEVILSGNYMPSSINFRKLFRFLNPEEGLDIDNGHDIDEPMSIILFSNERINVSLGYSSKEFVILSSYKDGRHFDLEKDTRRFKFTVKIDGIKARTQEEALKLLEKVSNSLFYQVDILYNITISLSPRRENRKKRIMRKKRIDNTHIEKKELNINYEYDEIPMSLYWLAKSSSYSPIFKYFALYQVLEYYYPIYTTIDAKERIQHLVKDPMFNISKDSDVLRLLNIVTLNNRKDLGDEREQLNLTLQRITSGDEIICFINENQYLHEYYIGKESKKLSEEKLRLTDNLGIVSDVAKRIYEIRCRIVHNKASEISNKILPTTKDIEYLVNDVELLEFLSRKAIIANSKPLFLI